jgi:superfamily II DNA or RNA helicase
MVSRMAQHAGFRDVSLVAGSGDHGADVVATFGDSRWIFQAKYRFSGGVDKSGAQEAVKAAGMYGAETAVLVCNARALPDVYTYQKEQKANGIDLRIWTGSYLLNYFQQLPDESCAQRELRAYQVDAVESVEQQRSEGAKSALVVMATGLGKSIVANQIIANELARNPYQEVLVLAHMNDLVRQLEWSSWPQLDKAHSTHLWTDGERQGYQGGVVFATWQSVSAAIQRGEDLHQRYGLVVVDEAHHAPSDSFSGLLSALSPNFLVGLTATPWRGDERSLSALFGEPTYSMDVVSGMQMGFLASVDYRMLTDGIDWNEVSRASKQGLSVADLNRLLLIPERDVGMVETIHRKLCEIEKPRALAFCRSIGHAERLQPLFAARGIRSAVIHSQLPRELRFRNLTEFRRGGIDLLISIEMLNEGIDVPDVNLIAFMRVTHSRRIFLQQLGRGLRLSEGKQAVIVLDFVADIRRIAAGLEMNRTAKERGSLPEVVRYKDGRIVHFENDVPTTFFDEYLADVANIQDLDDGSRLKFPGHEHF